MKYIPSTKNKAFGATFVFQGLCLKPKLGPKGMLITLFLTACGFGAMAQDMIKGSVKDETGAALPGVSIRVKNTTAGTLTDATGNYSLELPKEGDLLTASYIGYQSQEIKIDHRSNIDIVLTADKMKLNEIVVTGYSTQLKKDITGSIEVVDIDALKSVPAGSAMQALQGQASGVNVVSSGVPGATSNILIRGISSFGNTQPLVLIDGIEGNLNNISADDIASVQVLKDAGAAAIYGVRGSNGVIVVTTKRGAQGAPSVTYHGYYGTQRPRSRDNPLNRLNAQEFAQIYKSLYPNVTLLKDGIPDYTYRGPAGSGTGMEGDAAVDPSNYVLDPVNPLNNYIIQKMNKTGTDWYHAFFKPAPMTSHNVTASGGTSKANYLFSLGYLNQQGTVIETYLKRYSARINTLFKLNDHIRVGENVSLIYRQSTGFTNQQDFAPMAELYQMLPFVPLYDIKGNYGGTFGGPDLGSRYNPVAAQRNTYNNRYNTWEIMGNAYAEVDFLKHFTLRTSFGGTIDNNYSQSFSFTPYWNSDGFSNPNSYSEGASYSSSSTWTNTLLYTNEFGKHQLKVIVGSEAIKNYGRGVGGGSQNFFSTNFDYLVLNNGTSNVTNYSNAFQNTLFSLFSRLDYSYNDKYLAGITVRRDGSSRFGPEKRYGTFPSFSLGWRLSNEPFMKDIQWINDLKIRGSYGILGSQNNVNPTNSFTLFGGGFTNAYYDITGSSNGIERGFYQTNIGNPLTGWEEDLVSNIGFDATLFEKLTISLDVYNKSIKGLLFPQPLPATIGGAASPTINIGDIRNKGLDITAKYAGDIINHDLKFSVSANLTTYQNEIVKLPDPGYFDASSQQQLGYMVRNQEGHPMSSFFGYKVIGLFNSDEEVSKSPIQDGAAPGRFKYKDVDGDGSITSADRTFLGSPNPDFTYGLNIGLDYKGFDLSAFLYGSQGNQIVNTLKVNGDFFGTYLGGKSRDLLNAWTPDNMQTTIPKLETVNSFSTAQAMNSYFVEDGSYLRMKSLMLGYTFNPGFLGKLKINRLRLYLQATNLFTVTGYSELDPELIGPSSGFGIDYGNYPGNNKNFLLGVDIAF